jgi:hypothetical protein
MATKSSDLAMLTADHRDLKAAMDQCCRLGGFDRARQLDAMLADRPWDEVAQFAAYFCQTKTLHLKPWQIPPCHVADPDNPAPGEATAAKILRKMLAAGLSRWHPDPLAGLEKVADATRR